MVNSCNSRSPILLDTPERPTGTSGNTTVIEIPDSNERSHTRRRRLESIDDVIMADSPKRARVDVPVIDLTADNDEESSSTDNNSDSLYITLENSPVYAELLRGHYFTTAEHPGSRYRIRRAISLCHRPTSHQHRHQPEVDQSNLASLGSRTDSGRTNNGGLSNVRPQNFDSTILVDDDESPPGQSSLLDRGSGFSRPSCSRVSPPRMSTNEYSRATSPSARNERSRPPVLGSLHAQDAHDSDSERRSSRRDTSQQLRAVRRNHRRRRELQPRQLRERIEHSISSPFTHFTSTSRDNFGRTTQPSLANQETFVRSAVYSRPQNRPSANAETDPVRLNLRTSPPMERALTPYADFPGLMLPALLSWWGPDSRLRHFGNVEDEREDYEALWSLTERLGQVKPKGLSKAEMEEIPAFRYSAASKDSSNGSCVVCMMNYSNREKLRRLPCNHDFHAKCIDKWLKNNRSCPVCRKDVTAK